MPGCKLWQIQSPIGNQAEWQSNLWQRDRMNSWMSQLLEQKSESQVCLLRCPSHIIDKPGVLKQSEYQNCCNWVSLASKASGARFEGWFYYKTQHHILPVWPLLLPVTSDHFKSFWYQKPPFKLLSRTPPPFTLHFGLGTIFWERPFSPPRAFRLGSHEGFRPTSVGGQEAKPG